MIEEWIEIKRKHVRQDNIIAVSNFGNVKYRSGEIRPAALRQQLIEDGKHKVIAHIIIQNFKPRTDEDIAANRTWVDHISHTPSDMNVNDVRNLRWCTQAENNRFEEGNTLRRNAMKGFKHSLETRRRMSTAQKKAWIKRKGEG